MKNLLQKYGKYFWVLPVPDGETPSPLKKGFKYDFLHIAKELVWLAV